MKVLSDIIENWDLILDLWVDELKKITFVNDMSPKIYAYLENTQITKMSEYFTYLGIEKVGFGNLQPFIEDRSLGTKQPQLFKKYVGIYNLFKNMIEEENFEVHFKAKVIEKSNELRS